MLLVASIGTFRHFCHDYCYDSIWERYLPFRFLTVRLLDWSGLCWLRWIYDGHVGDNRQLECHQCYDVSISFLADVGMLDRDGFQRLSLRLIRGTSGVFRVHFAFYTAGAGWNTDPTPKIPNSVGLRNTFPFTPASDVSKFDLRFQLQCLEMLVASQSSHAFQMYIKNKVRFSIELLFWSSRSLECHSGTCFVLKDMIYVGVWRDSAPAAPYPLLEWRIWVPPL